MVYDLSLPGMPALLAEKIRSDINNKCEADNPPRHSWRIKPSELADDCTARLWFQWRWVAKKRFDGRMSRLFKRGHREEPLMIEWLRATGWEVLELDPARAGKNYAQFRINSFGGHMSGYLDGKCRHPIYTGNIWILLELKTYNTKRFAVLVNGSGKQKGGVQLTSPKYYGQACKYMKEHNLPACLFVNLNKNDDDIWPEIILRDDATADALDRKAHTVITSRARPARIAESPSYYECKSCAFAGICHGAEPVEINCRSCHHCVPLDGGKFGCEKWGQPIPDEAAIKAACGQHTPVR